MSDIGRRPDGPGWYWYEGPYVDDGDEIVDDGQPVPVEVVMSPWKHRENEVLFTGSSVAQKLSHLPGDFVPLTKPVADVSQLSDGYHTFAELYEHRHTLFAALMYAYAPLAFKTRRNQDGEEWPGWFIAGMDTPMGQLSYHMPDEWWDRLPDIRELERNDKYDGHTSADVLQRISWLRDFFQHPDPNPWAAVDAELTKPVAAPEPVTWSQEPPSEAGNWWMWRDQWKRFDPNVKPECRMLYCGGDDGELGFDHRILGFVTIEDAHRKWPDTWYAPATVPQPPEVGP